MLHNINDLYNHYLLHPQLCTDTRKIVPGAIFFALKGENFDGNLFAEMAVNAGCSLAVTENKDLQGKEKFFVVDDSLKTLQQLAFMHRANIKVPVIGITGTNGKTTTKELITSVLSYKYKVSSTKGNFNNHIGVPLTLLEIPSSCEIAVIEMGANHPGEIGELCKIAQPDHGIITNIGKAHLEGFGDLQGVIDTKKALYQAVAAVKGLLFINAENELLMQLSANINRITYGVSSKAEIHAEIVASNPFLQIRWRSAAENLEINSNLVGSYNFENVVAAICIGNYFGVEPVHIKNAIENYHPTNNRSQVIKTQQNTIIMDAYNANPTSMEAALLNFMQTKEKPQCAIIGDMRELGKDTEKEHKKIIALIKSASFEQVILVGPVFHAMKELHGFTSFPDVNQAAQWIESKKFIGHYFLIKGSRGIKLENLLPKL